MGRVGKSTFSRFVLGGLAALLLIGAGPSARAQDYDAGLRAYEAGQFQQAYDIWLKLAETGLAEAQYSLGKLLETGGGPISKDYEKAAAWYKKAAAQGVAHAQNNLGLMLAQGRGVPRDPQRAAELWLAAAQQDHAIAQFNLALAYFRGEGLNEDKAKAEMWFRRAAELGLADAQYALGQIRRLGLTGTVDESEALNWYQLAAAQGHEKAASEAAELRAAGVTPKAVAPLSPAATPQPAVAEPEPAPSAPAAPQVAETPPAAEAPANGSTAGAGGYSLWLRSEREADAAAAVLADIEARHPEIFAEARGAVVSVRLGKGGVFHRVVAEGVASEATAAALCQRLRDAEPGAFCKVLAAN